MKKYLFIVLLSLILVSCDKIENPQVISNNTIEDNLNILVSISWWCAMHKKDWCWKPQIYNEKNISSEKWKKLIEIFDFNAFKNVVFPSDACKGCYDSIDTRLHINYKWEEIIIDYDRKHIDYNWIKWSIIDKEKVVKFLKIWNEEDLNISTLENDIITSSKDCSESTIKLIIKSIDSLKWIIKCNYTWTTKFNWSKYEQYDIEWIKQNINGTYINNKIETLKVLQYTENNFIIVNETLLKLLVDDIEYQKILFYNLFKQKDFFVLVDHMDENKYIVNTDIKKIINNDWYLCSNIDIKNSQYKKISDICMDVSNSKYIQIKSWLEKISNLDLWDLEKITNEFLEKNNDRFNELNLKVDSNSWLIYRYSDIEKTWYIIYNLKSQKNNNQFWYYKSFKINDTSKEIIEIENWCSWMVLLAAWSSNSKWVKMSNLCNFNWDPIPKSFIDHIY